MKQVLRLRNKVQHYDWGGRVYIQNLIGDKNPLQKPYAELWMGTHNRGESDIIINGKELPLSQFIAQAPQSILGKATAEKFKNQLPFLFKILAVKQMLSIQAHPTKAAALAGFARENALGIPLKAKHRNYRDDNHKPEIMVAITDFWLLHGFKSIEGINAVLNDIPEFQFLQPSFEKNDIKKLYQTIMELSKSQVNEVLEPLRLRLLEQENIPKSSPDYWAKLGFEQHTHEGDLDKGIFSVYLFNLLHLNKGEAIYQAANVPHAYLEGINVELMASSDNVFRGGLTVKHVDTKELLQHLIFDSITPKVFTGKAVSDFEVVYPTIAPDFEVSVVELPTNNTFTHHHSDSCCIAILLNGSVEIDNETFKRGDSFFVPADYKVDILATETTEIYKAYVPF